MARRYRFVQVDVFTDHAVGGNQLAVVTDARGLTTDEMHLLTREMNSSERVFVLPADRPDVVKRVRIFSSRRRGSCPWRDTLPWARARCSRGRASSRCTAP